MPAIVQISVCQIRRHKNSANDYKNRANKDCIVECTKRGRAGQQRRKVKVSNPDKAGTVYNNPLFPDSPPPFSLTLFKMGGNEVSTPAFWLGRKPRTRMLNKRNEMCFPRMLIIAVSISVVVFLLLTEENY